MRLSLVLLAGAVARAEKKDNKSKNDECQMAVGGKLIRFKPIAHVDYGKKRSGPPTLADATCGGYGYFGQTCCVLDAEQPYVNSKTGQKFAVTRYRGQVGARLNVTRCLPKVVIGGVQKGGSTALAAILSAHPNVQFAPHKELHYFDGGPAFCRGTAKYLSQMKPMNAAVAPHAPGPSVGEFISAEATPFYVASPVACRNFAAEMPDDAKLIVIVREPVSRLYSEFQMERRRVEPQRKFLGNLQRHAASLMLCYAKSAVEKNQSTALAACLNGRNATGLMSRDRENRYAMLLGRVSSVIARVREVAVARTPEGDGALTRFPPGSLARLLDALRAGLAGPADKPRVPHAQGGPRDGGRGPREMLRGPLRKANYVAKTDEEAHAFLKKCKPKANGAIQRDFVYRSLYATQLRRCYYQGVKRAQTLVLDGAALRDDPAAVAKDVEAFAGLPAFAYAPDLVSPRGRRAGAASIAKAFPSFDERIGWSIHGEYDDEGCRRASKARSTPSSRPQRGVLPLARPRAPGLDAPAAPRSAATATTSAPRPSRRSGWGLGPGGTCRCARRRGA
ncbi:heparan sulfate sulfotransferase [Aureococcus anophagefferens]|nr:heparan sulfate sulfotransferase [Aureococcus anophagefferens]